MQLQDIGIRPIMQEDNQQLAKIVRETLKEFNLDKPGTVYFDATTDALYQLFQKPRSAYYVAEHENYIVGGSGIYATDGLPPDTCELVKMYLIPEARGMGLGKLLIEKSLEFAKAQGYRFAYIESMPELKKALKVYEKFGFEYLQAPMGNSGHYGCKVWMQKKL